MAEFRLVSNYKPTGDQPQAIEKLTEGVRRCEKYQTLLGVTGSGKTFTVANLIANVGKPSIVISHNKTLAAQLYGELKGFFPHNAVEFFISYYDYYQPEAYVPQTDTYIEKDTSMNDDIDRLRLRATSSLLEREDVVIVASVSCIYGLGSPKDYKELLLFLEVGEEFERDQILKSLIDIHYSRNDIEFARGTFRVRGDTIEVHPAYEETAIRLELFGDKLERISVIDTLKGDLLEQKKRVAIYPAKHFVTTPPQLEQAIKNIEIELEERLNWFRERGKLLEAQRLESRTKFDLEMMREIGYCPGIENYSRHLSGRKPGEKPYCLLDFFPKDFLIIIDESHQTIPQIRGMYAGDRSRKEVLVEYGFRLPSALDNRPLRFEEFLKRADQVIYLSATPDEWEISRAKDEASKAKIAHGGVVEQLVRPTGLIDPQISIRKSQGQVAGLIKEIRLRVAKKERILVTTLTKRMAEELATYLEEQGIKVHYLHSEIETLDRSDILDDLRGGKYDVIVGINLLREGLDLPEVSLVVILDADKEGFLRSKKSLIQVMGRASRNVFGKVIMYADQMTGSMRGAIKEIERRRKIQLAFNLKHHIKPKTIEKPIRPKLVEREEKEETISLDLYLEKATSGVLLADDRDNLIKHLTKRMREAARVLDFETAALIRDQIKVLRKEQNKLN